MSLGLLDLPAPLFDASDWVLAVLHIPAVLRIVVYAYASAWISMHLYRRLSDQRRLGELREQVAQSQRAMTEHEGDFADLGRLIRQNLRLSLRQLGVTLRPALLASLPLLLVLPWLSNRFDIQPPTRGSSVPVCAEPSRSATALHWRGSTAIRSADSSGCWVIPWPGTAHSLTLTGNAGEAIYVPDPDHPVRIVHKFIALNWLIGDPGGYLPATAPADRLLFALPARDLTGLGPSWSRGWEGWYFAALVVFSVAFKLRWRLN